MSNDNDKDQEYQKNMGKRLRKIRKHNLSYSASIVY